MTYMTHIFTTIISTVRKKNNKKTQPLTKFPRTLRSWIFLDEDCLVCSCRYTCDFIWTIVRLLLKNANSHLCYLLGGSVKQPGFLYVLGRNQSLKTQRKTQLLGISCPALMHLASPNLNIHFENMEATVMIRFNARIYIARWLGWATH